MAVGELRRAQEQPLRRCGLPRRRRDPALPAPRAPTRSAPCLRPPSSACRRCCGPGGAGTSAPTGGTRSARPCRTTWMPPSVFTGEADWHSLARKLVKSWRPTRAWAATCMRSASSGTGTCQTRPRSRAGRAAAGEDAVEVAAAGAGEAGVEVGRDRARLQDRDRVRAEVEVERAGQPLGQPGRGRGRHGRPGPGRARRRRCGRRRRR